MKQQKAIVVLNGQLNQLDLLRSYQSSADLKIAVDGGLRYFRQAAISPDVLIGDLDSITDEDRIWAETQGVEIQQYPVEKDATDFELALFYLAERGISWVRILAALGGRLDQTLANCFLLLDDRLAGLDIRFVDGHEEVCLVRHSIRIHGTPGDIVSLIPLQPVVRGVRTQQLKYPLHDEDLWMHQARGVSNVMLQTEAVIEVQEGHCLLIHTRQES